MVRFLLQETFRQDNFLPVTLGKKFPHWVRNQSRCPLTQLSIFRFHEITTFWNYICIEVKLLNYLFQDNSSMLFLIIDYFKFYSILWSCMPSRFSQVWLFATPWTVARQDALSMGFPRQGYWSGGSCPSPGDLPNPRTEPASPETPGLQVGSLELNHWGSPSCGHINTKRKSD